MVYCGALNISLASTSDESGFDLPGFDTAGPGEEVDNYLVVR